MLELIYLLALLIGSTLIVWKGSEFLEGSSEKLSVYYELPPIVQGAIIAAIGSSFPELSSTVISSLLHGEFELGVSVIIGSAIFNILVIPSLSGIFSKDKLETNRDLVYKEAQFYMVAVATLFLDFSFAVIYYPQQEFHGKMTRLIALMPIALYLLYIFIQYQDTMDYQAETAVTLKVWKQWLQLLAALLIIVVGVEGMVRSVIGLGNILNTPSFLWGLTVIAAGTSISDAFVSIHSARNGRSITSIANVLGSNTFDLLIAVPVGVLIGGSVVIDFSMAAPLMAFLVFATVVLFVMIRTSLELDRLEAWTLLGVYGLFLLWMVLETAGITGVVS